MSKRIFQAKAEAVLPIANGRTPNCYYHKFPITQFCVKSTAFLTKKNALCLFARNAFPSIRRNI